MQSKSNSLSAIAWRKFTRNPIGVVALSVVVFSVVISVLGYLITPDSSPFSNTQTLEISTQKPGFTVNMLNLPLSNQPPAVSWWHRMLFGAKSQYKQIPFQHYDLTEDSLCIRLFDPDGDGGWQCFGINQFDSQSNQIANKHPDSTDVLDIQHNTPDAQVSSSDKLRINSVITKRTYWLGTDQFGRDLLSRMIIGTRVSLSVGAISVSISLVLGLLLGAMAGFFGKKTDQAIMWFINVVWSIPTLLLVIALTFALGRGFWQVFVAVGLTMWVEVARVVRGQFMSIREKEFVEAGRALGFSNSRIITRHILPNILSPVIVISAANFASAILIEAGLSFLGIGVQPPMPSWGSMVKEYYSFIILDSAYLAIIPGIAIVILVLAFLALGNALQDALDVKL
jgi:peptide/nickel transport system permease protein